MSILAKFALGVAFLGIIIGILPTATLPLGMEEYLDAILELTHGFITFVPFVGTLFAVFLIIVGTELTLMTAKIVTWLYNVLSR